MQGLSPLANYSRFPSEVSSFFNFFSWNQIGRRVLNANERHRQSQFFPRQGDKAGKDKTKRHWRGNGEPINRPKRRKVTEHPRIDVFGLIAFLSKHFLSFHARIKDASLTSAHDASELTALESSRPLCLLSHRIIKLQETWRDISQKFTLLPDGDRRRQNQNRNITDESVRHSEHLHCWNSSFPPEIWASLNTGCSPVPHSPSKPRPRSALNRGSVCGVQGEMASRVPALPLLCECTAKKLKIVPRLFVLFPREMFHF